MSAPDPHRHRLPPDLLHAISQHGNRRTYPARAILVNEGDEGDSIYVLLTGRLKVYTTSDEGKDFVFTGELGPGEYFGELALDGGKRSASVVALEPSVCIVVPGSEFRAFLVEHPDFAVHLTHKLIALVRSLTHTCSILGVHDVYGRIVYVLMDLSDPEGESRVVRVKLTHQDIADRIGSSREMVTRVMKDLTPDWIEQRADGRYVIKRKLPHRR